MKEPIYVEFDIEPVAKGRPKFTVRGGYAKAYTPKKTQSFEDIVKTLWLTQVKRRFDREPLQVTIDCYQQFPVSKPKTKDVFNTTKPDLDNYIKSISDALNGIAMADDATIVGIIAIKRYALKGGFSILIEDASDMDKYKFNYKKEMEKQKNGTII